MRRKIVVWLVFLMIMGGMIGFVNLSTDADVDDGIRYTSKSGLTSHDPIYIDGNENFPSANGVTSGSGTESDPYIIENWDINASAAHGIHIENTDVYFIIRNCVVHDGIDNFHNGIHFYNVTNGTIDTVITFQNIYAVFIESSTANTIINHTSYNNYDGIILCKASKNNITNCVWYNNSYGIVLSYSSNNIIFNCTSHNNNMYGVSFYYSSNNVITDSSFNNNSQSGIRFDSSSNNKITNCMAHNNSWNGIFLYSSSNNIITNCTFYGNSWYGVWLYYLSEKNKIRNCVNRDNYWGCYIDLFSSNNQIYHNIFINNTNQAYDSCTNFWDNGYLSGGNYWDNWTIPDNNSDGFVDDPYHILGGSNMDNFPFTTPYSWLSQPIKSVYNVDKHEYYDIVQEAIENANVGDTIKVFSEIYYENIVINKTLTLIGEDKNTTIIDGSNYGDVIYISANYVNISSLMIRNSGSQSYPDYDSGIKLRSSYSQINDCIISNNFYGIYNYEFSSTTISNCTILNNDHGASFWYSSNSTFLDSSFLNNAYGIELQYSANCKIVNSIICGNYYKGISFGSLSENNQIAHCLISDCGYGISLSSSPYNNITDSIISNNSQDGICLSYGSYNTTITNCTILNNTENGIYMYQFSSNNLIANCSISNCGIGINIVDGSSGNILKNNMLFNNSYNFVINDNWVGAFYQDIDHTNTINGQAMYYLIDQKNLVLDSNNGCIGFVALISCSNITLRNLNIATNSHGALLVSANNCSVINCTFSNNLIANIELLESSNITITSCTLSNAGNGVYIHPEKFGYQSENCIITNCNIFSNYNNGILLSEAYNITIHDCTLSNNSQHGIYLQYSHNNLITNSRCLNNLQQGIYLYVSSNNTIINTTLVDNSCGIRIEGDIYAYAYSLWPQYSSDNIVTRSNISSNSYGVDILIGKNNTVTACRISENYYGFHISFGILFPNSYNNTIYCNNFIDNINQAGDYCSNFWDNGTVGNYWSDYNGSDVDDDGIGDNPYNISGGDNMDNYPLIEPVGIDTIKPKVTITGVENNTYYNVNVTPMITIFDLNLNTATITLDGKDFTSGTTITEDGTYTLFIQVTDKMNNKAEETITFTIDKTVLTITIAESSKTTTKNSFTMHWSASEDIQYYEVSVDGVNWVNVSTGTQYVFTLSKGENTLYVRGTDLAGNKGTDTIAVTYKKPEEKKPWYLIPGFEATTLLVTMIGVCIILLRKRKDL